MKIPKLPYIICLLCISYACKKKVDGGIGCPMVENQGSYFFPMANASGKIGFSYAKTLRTYRNGSAECGYTIRFDKDNDSSGFWMADVDGKNRKLLLPYPLAYGSWNDQGDMIAFSGKQGLTIMPFDGNNFDLSRARIVGVKGSNYDARWSPSGKQLVYRQTTCTAELACGLWVTNIETGINRYIPNSLGGVMCTWKNEGEVLFTRSNMSDNKSKYIGDSLFVYNINTNTRTPIKFLGPNITYTYELRISPDKKYLGLIATGDPQSQLYRMKTDGTELKQLTTEGAESFSWMADNQLIYVSRVFDENYGTIWKMDVNGNNKVQLTKNN